MDSDNIDNGKTDSPKTPDAENNNGKSKKLSKNSRLKKLEQQHEKIRLALARERSKLAHEARRNDTRRKILVGALILTEAEKDSALHARLFALLESQLTRSDDRFLFGFDPLPSPGNENKPDTEKAKDESA